MHRYQRQLRQQEEGLLHDGEILTLSPNRIRHHHPKCLNHKSNQTTGNLASSEQSGTKLRSCASAISNTDDIRDGSSSEPHSESSANRVGGAVVNDENGQSRAVGNLVNIPMIDSEQLVVVRNRS